MKIFTMKYLLSAFCFLFLASNVDAQKKVEWMSWNDAIAASEKNPKKLYVDIYTDWCGYCKKMDRETFTDPTVIEYLNKNFYPVKFDAEQKEEIVFSGTTFKHKPGGRGGTHELAVALLNNRMGYPAFVILDEEAARILISPGFKGPADVMMEMKYANEEIYKTKHWQTFQIEEKAARQAAQAKANTPPAKPATPATNKVTPAKTAASSKTATKTTPAKAKAPTKPAMANKAPATEATKVATPTKKTAPTKPATPNRNTTATKAATPAKANQPSMPNESVYKVVEEMPRFPGCESQKIDLDKKTKCSQEKMLQYIYENLKYPGLARENGIEGTVVVQYKIGKDGKIYDVVVTRDIGQGCGEEAARIVRSMPNWIPGMQRGKPVAVLFTLPIKFMLESTDDKKQKRKDKKKAKALKKAQG